MRLSGVTLGVTSSSKSTTFNPLQALPALRAIRAPQDLLDLHGSGAEIGSVHYAIAFFAKTLSRPDLEIEELKHYLEAVPSGPAADVARERLAEATESIQAE